MSLGSDSPIHPPRFMRARPLPASSRRTTFRSHVPALSNERAKQPDSEVGHPLG